MRLPNRRIIIFAAAVAVLIALNLFTFAVAIPETYTLTPGINAGGSILAKDFSAYYVGAWRLWNNPGHLYTVGALGGEEPLTPPKPEAYKYLPSFLLLLSPALSLSYQHALWAFNIIQFGLLPIIALMLYRLLKDKGLALTFLVMVIALLLPFPTPQWGASVSYYWQWGEGQAKVLQTFLLVLSVYLASRRQPLLSAVALAFGFFDPRFGLLAMPLWLMYNWRSLKIALLGLAGALALSNAVLLYPGLCGRFVSMAFAQSLSTPLYYYSLIPFSTFVALIFINIREMIVTFDYFGKLARFTKGWKIKKVPP